MQTLSVVSESSGREVGTITMADGTVDTTGVGRGIFDQIRRGKGWDERQTFDALAQGGWSNGYVTVQPASTGDGEG